METGVTIVNVFDFLGPIILRITMDFIKKQVSPSMSIMILSQVNQAILVEPQFIKRHIQNLMTTSGKCLSHALKQQSRLSYTTRPPDTEHTCIPWQLMIKVPLFMGTHLGNKPVTIGI